MIDVIPTHYPPPFELFGQQKPLGVVGGMGSLATANFLQVLARKSRADRDQDHIPFIALSLPNIFDRSQAISIGSAAPLRQIVERAYWLEKAGCGAIAIPCNTAHFWDSQIKQALSIELINLKAITRKAIYEARHNENNDLRIITLGTSATMQHSLYPPTTVNRFGDEFLHGFKGLQDATVKIIGDVKSGNITRAEANLTRLIQKIRSYKPDIIILGCSELSAISASLANDDDVIDPINILADACIKWWQNDG
ncbi:amino acid racemase [Mesorhizobium sp. AR02]|uniref:aspartate/glutamate racemase family protein n=1 Tax=Mesorhizobium sp. AR02 TaxID=2865837 RepID=UPI00215ECD9B|nr:amino acid racemase [Mesorhizobium sp. AR02]UVK50475.1 amino acid racemase [Mesorhizobium sp. AR02]